MENQIDRKSDESLYQPKIHSERIKELHNLRQTTGKPMTVLVDQAIRELAESYNSANHIEDPLSEEVKETTWEELCEYRRLLDELDYAKCLWELEKFKTNEQRGRLIEHVDPKPAIKKHQETAEWEYRDEAKFWNEVASKMDERFFKGFLYPDGRKVPPPVIAFDNLRNKNTIACYDLFPAECGIVGKITFNTPHYKDVLTESGKVEKVWERERYSQGETLLYEYIHLWQQIGCGKDAYRWEKHMKDTHNKEFVSKAEELGIHPKPVSGVHTKIATLGSPIDILLKEMGIFPPYDAHGKPEDKKQNWADWILSKHTERPKGRSRCT